MGKLEARAVDKHVRFIAAVEAGEETVTALCQRFGSRAGPATNGWSATGWKGSRGWSSGRRRRAPMPTVMVTVAAAERLAAQAVSAAIAERCLRAHPTWGHSAGLARAHDATVGWPAASTIRRLFDREGLTIMPKLRRRCAP
jgi:hypothetical protein